MGFLSVDTDIHLNDCLVHGNLHWGNNFVFFIILNGNSNIVELGPIKGFLSSTNYL